MVSSLKKADGEQCAAGFSIIEVVVAVGIIAVSFVTLSTLFNYNLRMEILSRNKIIASYLAQEAAEVVRQTRDSNWFAGNGWLDGIPVDSPTTNPKTINIITYNNSSGKWDIKSVNSTKTAVYLIPGQRYAQKEGTIGGAQDTIFKRWINLTQINDHTVQVDVHVDYGSSQTLDLTSYVYNWY